MEDNSFDLDDVISNLATSHLETMKSECARYFPDFLVNLHTSMTISDEMNEAQEQLISLIHDSSHSFGTT